MVDRAHALPHLPAPGARVFALLAGLEAGVRAILISVLPLEMYRAFGDAGVVSGLYFAVGCASLAFGLLVPWITTHVPRRWAYTGGIVLFLIAHVLGIIGGKVMVLAVACGAFGTVAVFICLNAYVLDYIARNDLGRVESLRMFYAALAWTVGPVAGVTLLEIWRPLPFLVATFLALTLLVTFWILRLGNGKVITRAKGPAPNPVAYLGRFLAQPRLIAGWTFAVIRSSGWWVFVVYLPIFAIEAGLGPKVGGITLSLASMLMFTTPLMLRWLHRHSVRAAVRIGFLGAALAFLAASPLAGWPMAAVILLMVGAFFLVLLDVTGGLPFLMAVKPSERTEMAAVYSSFRDVSGIVTPGLAYVVLLAAPLSAIFAATGVLMLAAHALAGRLHPKLGVQRHVRGAVAGE